MDNKAKGYWSIAAQKHLKGFTTDSVGLDEYDDIDLAGKAGRFISSIRGNSKITNIKKIRIKFFIISVIGRELNFLFYLIIVPFGGIT